MAEDTDWRHPVSPNTLAAITKAGLRSFYELLINRGDAGFEPALEAFRKETTVMFDDLKREVGELSSTVQSALAVLKDLKERVASNVYNPEELKAIVEQIDLEGKALAAAIASTPEAPVEPQPGPISEPDPVPVDPVPAEPVTPSEPPAEPQP